MRSARSSSVQSENRAPASGGTRDSSKGRFSRRAFAQGENQEVEEQECFGAAGGGSADGDDPFDDRVGVFLADEVEGFPQFGPGIPDAIGVSDGDAGASAGEAGGQGGLFRGPVAGFQKGNHFLFGNGIHAHAMAAGMDRGEDGGGAGGDEQEEGGGRGFLQGLKDGVHGRLRERIGLVDEDDASGAFGGAQ